MKLTLLFRYFNQVLLEIFNKLMFSGSSRLNWTTWNFIQCYKVWTLMKLVISLIFHSKINY